ncbi:MAG: type II toxin-antitoxin system VapC family toxin [Brasilonema sp.]
MKTIFVDTLYWIAITNPKDQCYSRALEVQKHLQATQLVTTETVLIEYLNYFCGYSPRMRQTVASVARSILKNPNVEVVLHTHEVFLTALTLYAERLDKGYSLIDCISMVTMQDRNLTEVLTHDRHFAQEGFMLLL